MCLCLVPIQDALSASAAILVATVAPAAAVPAGATTANPTAGAGGSTPAPKKAEDPQSEEEVRSRVKRKIERDLLAAPDVRIWRAIHSSA